MAADHSLHLDAEHAIHRVLSLYSHLLDNQRWSELDQIFTDNAVFTIEPMGVRMGSLRAIIERFSVTRHPLGHHFTNPVIDVAPDGQSAKVVIKLLVVRPDSLAGTGSYDDEFVLTPKGWRISQRAAKVAVAKPDAVAAAKAAALTPGRPRLSLGVPPAGGLVDNDHFRLIEFARQADAAGVDALGVSDHVVMGERLDRYRWGPFPAAKGKPWLEPLALIATMAGATRRIRFMTGILIAPLRPATLLAKTLATIDQLSQGRLDVGVGTGWQPEEYESMNLDFDKRAQILDDNIGACRALWGPSPATFTSPTLSFKDIWCDPKPWQHGGPPVFFSGPLTARNMKRIITMGSGWIPIMGASVDEVIADTRKLREAFAAASRDPNELRVRGTLPAIKAGAGDKSGLDLDATLATAHRFAEGGITDVTLPMGALTGDYREVPAKLDELMKAWHRAWSR